MACLYRCRLLFNYCRLRTAKSTLCPRCKPCRVRFYFSIVANPCGFGRALQHSMLYSCNLCPCAPKRISISFRAGDIASSTAFGAKWATSKLVRPSPGEQPLRLWFLFSMPSPPRKMSCSLQSISKCTSSHLIPISPICFVSILYQLFTSTYYTVQ